MKAFFKDLFTRILEFQARRLLKKYKPKIIAVTGSVGKTSTKLAIGTVLSQKYKVLAHYSSYNVPVALPLAMFDLNLPENLASPLGWLRIFWHNEKVLRGPFDYEVFVLELGSDHPGEIEYFRKYIHPDIAVVTAVSPEHMEGFGSLDAVAKEELAIAKFSKLTIINRDDIDGSFVKYVPDGINIDTYGTSGVAEYHYLIDNFIPGEGFSGKFVSPELGQLPIELKVVGEHNIRSTVVAGAVGIKMGLSADQIKRGMQAIVPIKGRMRLLKGLKDSTIIDDTYNSSPAAAIAALQTLYVFPAKQRIAIIGSMNEMGEFSKTAHEQVASALDPALLDWVVTIGADAEKYIAPIAGTKGCQVRSFKSPYEAGAFAHSVLDEGAVILAKGSQNGVFAEEAIKILLHSPEEVTELVRQTPDWMAKKEKQFGAFQDRK